MYIKSNPLVTNTLFTEPTSTGNLVKNTLFAKPDDKYRETYIDRQSFQTPVSVTTGMLTSGLSTMTASASANLSYASSRSDATQGYASSAKSILEQMDSLAEEAAKSSTDDSARADLDKEAAGLMEKLNKIYTSASFNGEYVMRGGTGSFVGGLDGASFEYHNGDASASYLGIDGLRLDTKAHAETALENLDSAIQNMSGQYSLAGSEAQSFQETYNAIQSSLAGTQANVANEVSQEYAQTAMENSKAVISAEMVYAMGVQGKNLRDESTKRLENALRNISDVAKSAADKSAAEEAEQKKQAEEQKKTRDQSAATQEQTPAKTPAVEESSANTAPPQTETNNNDNEQTSAAATEAIVWKQSDNQESAPTSGDENKTPAPGA